MQINQGAAVDHGLGQGCGLNQVKPVIVGAGQFEVRGVVDVQRRRDVDHAQAPYAGRMVQRQPMRHAPAAVVPAHIKRRHVQRRHELDHVLGHGTLAVVAVVRQVRRLGRVAVAAQVGHDQIKVLVELARHTVPHHMGLWKAVQQQQHRPHTRHAA